MRNRYWFFLAFCVAMVPCAFCAFAVDFGEGEEARLRQDMTRNLPPASSIDDVKQWVESHELRLFFPNGRTPGKASYAHVSFRRFYNFQGNWEMRFDFDFDAEGELTSGTVGSINMGYFLF
jgi:hypothetical protein